MPQKKASKGRAVPQEAITDPRFSNFTTDPRFRLPSKKNARVKIDKRFSPMLLDDDFSSTAKVDRYGRTLGSGGKRKVLERLYQPEESKKDDEDKEDEEIEVEDDEIVARELKRADAEYDPARGGGFASSNDENDDDEEYEDEEEIEAEEETEEFPNLQIQQAGVPLGEVSSRIAIVNLDWENIRAVDLMAVFSSFVQRGGKVKKISIYKSDFGKERMEREEMDGPPKELFQRQGQGEEEEVVDSENDSDDEEELDDRELEDQIKADLLKEDDGKEYNNGALRQYQLDRLRYYYAVMECSDKDTAKHIYEATDGTEYLSSANFFDLRFVPDETDFDDRPTDECGAVPRGYKPHEFVTDALRQSKVKLTWDAEDSTRKQVIQKAFRGSRAEIGENDLRAYLGSDTSGGEEDGIPSNEALDASALSQKDLARQKMRAALGLPSEPEKSSKPSKLGPVGDMEITFTAGLSLASKTGVFTNEPIKDETTAEAYIRKERERKTRRREKAKAIREGRNLDDPAEADDDEKEEEEEGTDLGFDDPFFTMDEAAKTSASKAARKEARKQKRLAREAEATETAGKRAELELLMVENSNDAPARLDHFDINEITRAEKLKKKRGKKSKKLAKEKEMAEHGGKKGGLQEGFQMDVEDPRFKAVFNEHEFAIDPSNPKFKGTEGMKKLLEEGRRKRKDGEGEDHPKEKLKKQKTREDQKDGQLKSLVETLKRKSKK